MFKAIWAHKLLSIIQETDVRSTINANIYFLCCDVRGAVHLDRCCHGAQEITVADFVFFRVMLLVSV